MGPILQRGENADGGGNAENLTYSSPKGEISKLRAKNEQKGTNQARLLRLRQKKPTKKRKKSINFYLVGAKSVCKILLHNLTVVHW